jgi:enoyl-CoA hydratase/carnithine racemase
MTAGKNYGKIIYQVRDGMALLTIDKPKKHNSMSPDDFSNLREALVEADRDKDVKVIIITGAGSRAFCAGFDIMNTPQLPVAEARLLHAANLELNRQLLRTNKVTIAAVNGIAYGTGCEISLLCDLTVASQSATFAMSELGVGAYPGVVSSLLHHLLGAKKAKEFILTGRTINANKATEWGIVNEVAADERVLERAFELGKEDNAHGSPASRHVQGQNKCHVADAVGRGHESFC